MPVERQRIWLSQRATLVEIPTAPRCRDRLPPSEQHAEQQKNKADGLHSALSSPPLTWAAHRHSIRRTVPKWKIAVAIGLVPLRFEALEIAEDSGGFTWVSPRRSRCSIDLRPEADELQPQVIRCPRNSPRGGSEHDA